MEFQKHNNSFVYCDSNGKLLAEISYVIDKNIIHANHTFVDDSLRGRGIGKQLVERLIEYAKENKFLIYPQCSYVIDLFNRFEKYHFIDARKNEN